MGSFYSKPKLPDSQVFYTPPVPTPGPAVTPVETDDGGSITDAERAASVARRRSMPQTILTSFRGVLSQGDWIPQRKSLLGE